MGAPSVAAEPIFSKLFFRPDEAATILDVSIRTIYRRIEDGTITVVRFGDLYRIPRESLLRLLAPDA